MSKNMFLDLWREIRKSANRFLSILLIVVIGVSVFAGLRSAPKDMTYTIDKYFDKYNIMDFRVISTLGLTDDDIEMLESLDLIENVQPGYFVDALTSVWGSEIIYRINSIPDDYQNTDYINQMEIVEGRLPEKPNEIVIESGEMIDYGTEIGDELTFYLYDEDIMESYGLVTDTFTVVGKATTPLYLSPDRETSTIEGRAYNCFAYVLESAFDVEGYYTEFNITINGARKLNSFDKEYEELIGEAFNQIQNVGTDRSVQRADELREEAEKQLAEGQQLYDSSKDDFYTQVDDAEDQLREGYAELKSAEAQLEDLATFSAEISSAYNEQMYMSADTLQMAKEELANATEQYNTLAEQYNALRSSSDQYLAMMDQLADLMDQLQSEIEEISDQGGSDSTIAALQETLNFVKERYGSFSNLNDQLNEALAQVDEAFSGAGDKLTELQEMIADAEDQLDDARDDQMEQLEQLEQQRIDGQKEVDKGWKEYKEGQNEYVTQKTDGQQQLEDAAQQLVDARIEIEKLESAEWYILDRLSNYGFASYSSTVDSMEALAAVIPFFFLLVAILVCVTTMTRMVGEQRTIIGSYKALGYGDSAIIRKYVIYVVIASVIGGIVGTVAGVIIFPYAVYTAWDSLYTQPALSQTLHWSVIAFSFAITVIVMAFTAFKTTKKELNDVPAALMRPKAPKHGKATFIEKTALWRGFSFSQKVTARNILRYKKRLFMTVIGILGCTSLLLAALGMNDTINNVVGNQYGKVFSYNLEVSMSNGRLAEKLAEDISVEYACKTIASESMTVSHENKSETVTAMVADTYEDIDSFILLNERVTGKKLYPDDTGIIITEKLADNLKLEKGDYIEVMNQEMITKAVPIIGVTENYFFHYIYMTQNAYNNYFKDTCDQSTVFIDLGNDGGTEAEYDLYEALYSYKGVESVASYSTVAEDMKGQIEPIRSIVFIIILCAALLAFVVLYNLTNINISERIREIATIKVLGFKGNEVAMYIYRENAVMTFIGAILGLAGGIGLHRIIIKSIEQSYIMFGFIITWQSYVLAVILTFLFSTLVMCVMYRKLINIPMIESLKSIE